MPKRLTITTNPKQIYTDPAHKPAEPETLPIRCKWKTPKDYPNGLWRWGFDHTYADGSRMRKYPFNTMGDALAVYHEILRIEKEAKLRAQFGIVAVERPRLSQLVWRYLATRDEEQVELLRVVATLPGDPFVEQITPPALNEYIARRQQAGDQMSAISSDLNRLARPLNEARNLLDELANFVPPIIVRPLLADLYARRLGSIAKGPEHTRTARVFRVMLSLLPDGFFVDEWDTDCYRKFVQQRLDDGQAPSSVDREENILVAAINQAGVYYPELRQWKAPAVYRPKYSHRRREDIIPPQVYVAALDFLTRPRQPNEQLQSLHARHRVARVFRFLMLTGCRPKECYQLQKAHIEWFNQRIKIISTKTDQTRYIGLSRPLKQVLIEQLFGFDQTAAAEWLDCPLHELLAQKQDDAGLYVYVFTQGGKPNRHVYEWFRKAFEAAGAKAGKNTDGGLVSTHARHTVTTELLLNGMSFEEVRQLLGHSRKEMTLNYSHTEKGSLERMAVAIDTLEQKRLGQWEQP
jgi:integrase